MLFQRPFLTAACLRFWVKVSCVEGGILCSRLPSSLESQNPFPNSEAPDPFSPMNEIEVQDSHEASLEPPELPYAAFQLSSNRDAWSLGVYEPSHVPSSSPGATRPPISEIPMDIDGPTSFETRSNSNISTSSAASFRSSVGSFFARFIPRSRRSSSVISASETPLSRSGTPAIDLPPKLPHPPTLSPHCSIPSVYSSKQAADWVRELLQSSKQLEEARAFSGQHAQRLVDILQRVISAIQKSRTDVLNSTIPRLLIILPGTGTNRVLSEALP